MEKQPTKQFTALRKVCNIYWKEFKNAELKHDKISENLKVYSSGEDYIYFTPGDTSVWQEIGLSQNRMSFEAIDISEQSFDKTLRFIRKELKNKIIDPTIKTKTKIAEIKKELKNKRQELKDLELINTKKS